MLAPRKFNSLKTMNNIFPEFSFVNEMAFNELLKLSDQNPQKLIDLIRFSFSAEIFSTCITNVKRNLETVTDKMNSIALTWEIASFFKLPAFLLSNCRAPIENLNEASSIFKYFKSSGLLSCKIDEIRLIRNANSHKFSISKGYLIYNDGGCEVKITTAQIDIIYVQLYNLSSWWPTFVLYQLLYIPKFGIIFIYSIIDKILKNKEKIKDYVDGLKEFVPNSILNPIVKLSLKDRIKKTVRVFKRKMRNVKRKYLSDDKSRDFFLHMVFISSKEYHIN
ncbi:MAG TPA: hypothetical protein VGB37_02000 [Candidatus Lokiarchaeia archaeon]